MPTAHQQVHTVHFFVVLPEPLDLPSGFAIQRVAQPGTYSGESFRLGDGTSLDAETLSAGPLCRFFHRETPVDTGRTRAAVNLARWAWPDLSTGQASGGVVGLADLDPEETLVVEGPSGDLNEHEDDTRTAGPDQGASMGDPSPPMKPQTAVEMVHVFHCEGEGCTGEFSEEELASAFSECLRLVQALQRGAYAVTRQPYTLLTRATSAFATPIAVGSIDDDGFHAPDRWLLWRTNWNLLSELPPADISDAALGFIGRLVQHMDTRAFFSYLDFEREAVVASRNRGDNRSAAIFLGLACERLLDDLLGHLMWEDGEAPEAAPATFQDSAGITSRVRREFHPRLKGRWSPDQPGPVADWWEKVAKVRNKVVHGAYTPSDQEIEDGTAATHALVAHISDCLADRIRQEGKYRLTAVALMAEPGMRNRRVWTRRSQQAAQRFDEDDLWSLAARWKAAAERQRASALGEPLIPDASRAYVMYIVHSGGPSYWVEHDRVTAQARKVSEPRDLMAGQREALAALEASIKVEYGSADHALATTMEVASPAQVDALGDWQEEYRLIPGAEVMVDGTDRSAVS